MTTTNDGGIHPMVMKAARAIAESDGYPWELLSDYGLSRVVRQAQAALTECGALECLEALEECEPILDGKVQHTHELAAHMRACAAIAKVYGSAA